MATKKYTFTGEVKWAKVFEGNRDLHGFEGGYEEHEGMYKIDLKLDKDQRAVLKSSGSAKKVKIDDDNNAWVTFTRKHKDRFDWASGAPQVINEDGYPREDIIPNGSICEIVFSVYTTSKQSGTRLESVKVLKEAEAYIE
jgi:hypothetical protein